MPQRGKTLRAIEGKTRSLRGNQGEGGPTYTPGLLIDSRKGPLHVLEIKLVKEVARIVGRTRKKAGRKVLKGYSGKSRGEGQEGGA